MRLCLFILIVIFLSACSRTVFRSKWTNENAPDSFVVHFETSKGPFEVVSYRNWSPKAADRFYQLVKHGAFNNVLFYRVVPNFVAQFGNSDTMISKKWARYTLEDEPVIKPNIKGTISFARSGKNSRDMTVFINLRDNPKLDTIRYEGVTGFPTFGKIVNGMNAVLALYNGYGDSTMRRFDEMYRNRHDFLTSFPRLDSITKAYIKPRL